MVRREVPMLVGLVEAIPMGGVISPQRERQSLHGVTDKVAEQGIVRGTTDLKVARFRVIRAIIRAKAPKEGFDGAASAYWDEASQELFLGVSAAAKELVVYYAETHDGCVGYIHEVERKHFKPDFAIGGPDNWYSTTGVCVWAHTLVTFDDLAQGFGGPDLPDLPDPMTNPHVARDLRRESRQPYPALDSPRLATETTDFSRDYA